MYDEHVAQRFRDTLAGGEGVSEKRMMGGLCFLVNGNMVGGADQTKSGQRRFMFRIGKESDEAAAAMPVDDLKVLPSSDTHEAQYPDNNSPGQELCGVCVLPGKSNHQEAIDEISTQDNAHLATKEFHSLVPNGGI